MLQAYFLLPKLEMGTGSHGNLPPLNLWSAPERTQPPHHSRGGDQELRPDLKRTYSYLRPPHLPPWQMPSINMRSHLLSYCKASAQWRGSPELKYHILSQCKPLSFLLGFTDWQLEVWSKKVTQALLCQHKQLKEIRQAVSHTLWFGLIHRSHNQQHDPALPRVQLTLWQTLWLLRSWAGRENSVAGAQHNQPSRDQITDRSTGSHLPTWTGFHAS